MKPPCFHRRDQAGGSCGFPLHCTDESASLSDMIEGELDAELESADASAEGQNVSGTYSHVMQTPTQTGVQPKGGGDRRIVGSIFFPFRLFSPSKFAVSTDVGISRIAR